MSDDITPVENSRLCGVEQRLILLAVMSEGQENSDAVWNELAFFKRENKKLLANSGVFSGVSLQLSRETRVRNSIHISVLMKKNSSFCANENPLLRLELSSRYPDVYKDPRVRNPRRPKELEHVVDSGIQSDLWECVQESVTNYTDTSRLQTKNTIKNYISVGVFSRPAVRRLGAPSLPPLPVSSGHLSLEVRVIRSCPRETTRFLLDAPVKRSRVEDVLVPHRRVTFSTAKQAAKQAQDLQGSSQPSYYDSGLDESETPSSKSSSGPRIGPLALPEDHYERTTPDGSIGEVENPENGN
ncbi:hypothetical protein Baya_17049 [Bagarius yarrelli]|uniref:Uncharacterized protein n=1 Tax=Bagarius yarrelli TaxID=175774 RepID=A0A556VXA0_BAGYA|nr:hypothetical protein Baya_17049 [Bagarius yarrelli]